MMDFHGNGKRSMVKGEYNQSRISKNHRGYWWTECWITGLRQAFARSRVYNRIVRNPINENTVLRWNF